MGESEKKEASKLKKLTGLLKNLEEISSEKKQGGWDSHTNVSKSIGRVLGEGEHLWNSAAATKSQTYINHLESSYYDSKNPDFLDDLKEAKKYLKNIKRNTDSSSGLAVGIFTFSSLLGLFLLSSNITGNAIGNMTKSGSNFGGAILLILGIVGLFLESKKFKK